ncbi:sister chromatid cohesion C-terminus-domain-containing protein [Lipomyces tetrasporus]|uniref:Sister chromatid cohesion protein n=1 Tax=Lipomyces tetrasporus TaxID=54092 RepID=A0AAD7QTY6_9ASCO|nr:sister chromatid cohesion C-terminus-domain-containing protein [Lipomyces tetrasporus]KAJ8101405.1 sister chromatid cohesion C-terminus-domain-containing protein [Lipomyces tetrasporus]
MAQQNQSNSTPRIQVPVTLSNALQYTAFTSVTPAGSVPSLANVPEITAQTSIFQLPEQQLIQSRQTFDLLNAVPQSEQHASLIESHLQNLRGYLTTPDMQPLNFEVPAAFNSLPTIHEPMTARVPSFGLGRFSERLLLDSDVPLRFSVANREQLPLQCGVDHPDISLANILRTVQDAPSFPAPLVEPGPPQERSAVRYDEELAIASPQRALQEVNGKSKDVEHQRKRQKMEMYDQSVVAKPVAKAAQAQAQAQAPMDAFSTLPTSINNDDGQLQAQSHFGPNQEPYVSSMAQNSTPTRAQQQMSLNEETNMQRFQTPSYTLSEMSFAKPCPSSATSQGSASERAVEPESVSKKRRRLDETKLATLKSDVDELTLKAHSALEGLQSLIDAIFEADDNTERDTSGAERRLSSFWVVGELETEPLLANDAEIRLEGNLRRAMSSNVYREIPLDDILRLQKICMRSIRSASAIAWKGKDGLIDAEDSEIFSAISSTDNALKACKTITRTMLGDREEKQICSEDIVKELVDFVSHLLESLLIPLIPAISEMDQLIQYKTLIGGIAQETIRVLNLFYQLLGVQDLSENVITRLEFASINIIFAENAAKEKESYLGTSNIENLRVATMDILAQVFASYPDQRTFVLGEILGSLEKLPVSRLTARQYRLVGGGSIQLVTALILRLVQTAGSIDSRSLRLDGSTNFSLTTAEEKEIEFKDRDEFIQICQKCSAEAIKSSTDVVNFLVERAMKSTKSGDAPYRLLLDLFTEDFITVLENPEWPGAELLLRCLTMQMIGCANGETYGSQVNSMSLDLLGIVSVKLISLHNHPANIPDLALVSTNEDVERIDNIASSILLYLHKSRLVDSTAKSSYGYFFSTWTSLLGNFLESDSTDTIIESVRKLMRAVSDDSWASKEDYTDDSPASMKAKYDQYLKLLPLFKLYDRILSEILRALDHPRIVSRTKGLRVLGLLLAKDPSILGNANVMDSVSSRLRDSSPQVRDAAVDVVGKYILVKPEVTKKLYPILCERSGDTGTGVRRRVVKLLKDIYTATADVEIRTQIGDRLLRRLEDNDPGVVTLAKKTLEELLYGPTSSLSEVDELGFRTEINIRVNILLQIRDRSESSARLLQMLTLSAFEESDVSAYSVQQAQIVSKAMVENLFEAVIDWTDSRKTLLQSLFGLLSVFAVANRSLFEADQLVALQSYLDDTRTDASSFYILLILRHVLPVVGSFRPKFLIEVQQSILKRLTKFTLKELSEAVPCLRDISDVLKDTRRLAVTTGSCLKSLYKFRDVLVKGQLTIADPRVVRLLHLLGHLGRYCNLDSHKEILEEKELKGKGRTLSEATILALQLFTRQSAAAGIRRTAVRNLGMIAIAHPRLFLESSIIKILDAALDSDDVDLKDTVIKMFNEFLSYEQARADDAVKKRGGSDEKVDVAILKGEAKNFSADSVCSSLVQLYLDRIFAIALGSEDEYAFSAILLVEKIVRQGYANPRNCIPVLVALETSRRPVVRSLALELHQTLHEKHESLIEGAYLEGVRAVLDYNRRQSATNPTRSMSRSDENLRPLYSVIKSSRSTRKKFIGSVTKAMDFDVSKFVNEQYDSAINHLIYVTFSVRNIACLDFSTADEPHHVVYAVDQIIGSSGMSVLYMITDYQSQLSQLSETPVEGTPKTTNLKGLTICCAILYALWQIRQHIKRLYNLSEQNCRTYQPSKSAKDTRPISKITGYDEHLHLEDFCLHESFDNDDENLAILERTKDILAALDNSY